MNEHDKYYFCDICTGKICDDAERNNFFVKDYLYNDIEYKFICDICIKKCNMITANNELKKVCDSIKKYKNIKIDTKKDFSTFLIVNETIKKYM